MYRIAIRVARIALLLTCAVPMVILDNAVSMTAAHRELIELSAGALVLGTCLWALDRFVPMPARRR